MLTEWKGSYLDGRTAARQGAAVRLLRTGLQITTEGGATAVWPYAEIRQTQGFYTGQEVRLERGGSIPEVLLIRDATFLAALQRVAPEAAGRFHDPGRRRLRIGLTAFAAIAVVGVTAGVYLWGIPGLAAVVAPRVPPAWEDSLGRTVSEHIAPEAKRCTEATRSQAIQDIASTLLLPVQTPYTFHVVVANTPMVNALAAPGGHVVIFRGLLEQTQSAEELAGVMAHEFQHILRRHTTRALLRHASTSLLIAGLSGDLSGAMVYGLEGARILGELRYSRQDEEEADREGLRMLVAAGVDPSGMITFFEALQKKKSNGPALPRYASTHPPTDERIARLQLLVPTPRPAATPLLPGTDWRDVRAICRATAPLAR